MFSLPLFVSTKGIIFAFWVFFPAPKQFNVHAGAFSDKIITEKLFVFYFEFLMRLFVLANAIYRSFSFDLTLSCRSPIFSTRYFWTVTQFQFLDRSTSGNRSMNQSPANVLFQSGDSFSSHLLLSGSATNICTACVPFCVSHGKENERSEIMKGTIFKQTKLSALGTGTESSFFHYRPYVE